MNTQLKVFLLAMTLLFIGSCKETTKEVVASNENESPAPSLKKETKIETAEALSTKAKEMQITKLTEELERAAKEKATALELQKKKEEADKLATKIKMDSLQKVMDDKNAQMALELEKNKAEIDKNNRDRIDRENERKHVNSNRKIRITVNRFVCELSDDEGPNNDADMDIFWVKVNAFQQSCTNNESKRISDKDQTIYHWRGPEKEVKVGDVHTVNRSVDIVFNNENCDINKLLLHLDGYAREQDNGSSSADEEGEKRLTLRGNKAFGNHSFKLRSSDFVYRYEVTISKVGW